MLNTSEGKSTENTWGKTSTAFWENTLMSLIEQMFVSMY